MKTTRAKRITKYMNTAIRLVRVRHEEVARGAAIFSAELVAAQTPEGQLGHKHEHEANRQRERQIEHKHEHEAAIAVEHATHHTRLTHLVKTREQPRQARASTTHG